VLIILVSFLATGLVSGEMPADALNRYVVDRVENFPPGCARTLEIDGRSIGILRVDDRFYAIRNRCPHHGAPLCGWAGGGMILSGTVSASKPHEYEYAPEDVVIRCPWHGFEFDLSTGYSLVDPVGLRVKTYRVEVEGGSVVVYA
jgi:nitrite reductase/ring-hydroxylating ferredoxin subunit